ncbi:hypothetical protein CARUB_v10018568mg [Capsella rubella]|uniref:Uncharacterized protein n=1 Tax=Capsella rubella TaxID=81985 RepID=R0HMT2_9BRAS|nr:hypothetical protein CARUB_v10018568mg [Capsella rubella]
MDACDRTTKSNYFRGTTKIDTKGKRPIEVEDISCKKIKSRRALEVEPIQILPPEWLLKARLSVPFRHVKDPEFLTHKELIIIHENAMKTRDKGASVDLVDPDMKKHACP